MRSPILFIGYEPSLHDEIREFLKERQGVVHFSDNAEDTIQFMDSGTISTVVIKFQRLEDAAILRYINLNYQGTQVLVMPGERLQDAIPALASGQYKILHAPFTLEELTAFM